MIQKQDLKGKKVSFRDKDGKYRICKVYKTIKVAQGEHREIIEMSIMVARGEHVSPSPWGKLGR